MLIHDGLEFHNVGELRQVEGVAGLRLQRVKEEVRLALNDKAQERMLIPRASEIRFISEGDTVAITLASDEAGCELIPFWGDFQGLQSIKLGHEVKTVELTYPERLKTLDPAYVSRGAFSARTWRLVVNGGHVHYVKAEGQGIRPPEPKDKPGLRLLAYGTSITQGSLATKVHLSYVSQLGRKLGADVINLGVGGSCYCEPELADDMASRDDWDAALLCLSVNMMGFTVEQFQERVTYLVGRMAAAHPRKPVFCMSILPYYGDFCSGVAPQHHADRVAQFRQALKEAVQAAPGANVHLFQGPDMLQDIGGLTVDLLHPGDYGMMEIADRLAKGMKPILDQYVTLRK